MATTNNFIQRPFVSLVGAGPGCADLVTLRAKRMLEHADVVLYDALAHVSLLTFCSPKARLIHVGKRKGHHAKNQTEILDLIKTYYSQGMLVVRLKGGDPMLFGRGGEEVDFLKKEAMAFDIVPGVSSLVGVPASVGISLTHRHASRQVTALTGNFGAPSSPWNVEIPDSETLVFFMATTSLPSLVEKLLQKSQLNNQTPCALIGSGTTSQEHVLVSNLGNVLAQLHVQPVAPPALFIVGQVVTKKGQPSKKLLQGKRLVLFRDIDSGMAWRDTLEVLGCDVLHVPMVSYAPLRLKPKLFALLEDARSIVFSSRHGVEAFVNGLKQVEGVDIRILGQKKVLAFGHQTKRALESFGVSPDVVLSKDSLLEGLKSYDSQCDGKVIETILFPCSTLSENINLFDSEIGAEPTSPFKHVSVAAHPVYSPNYTRPKIPFKLLPNDFIYLGSPSQVDAVLAFSGNLITDSQTLIVPGKTTLAHLNKLNMKNKIMTCESPNVDGVVSALLKT